MDWPNQLSHEESPEAHQQFVNHLFGREVLRGAGILCGIGIVALILSLVFFPTLVVIAVLFYFAYILLFTLPMWLGLFEDDIEEEEHRHDHSSHAT